MSPEYHRNEEGYIPNNVKWIMKFINNVGFPIAVCIWLSYQQYVQGKEIVKTLSDFKEVMISLKTSIDQQNRILRHHPKKDDDD